MNKEEDVPIFKLSAQAIGAVMMALQKCILEQTDITEIFNSFNFVITKDGLMVINPPTFVVPKEK